MDTKIENIPYICIVYQLIRKGDFIMRKLFVLLMTLSLLCGCITSSTDRYRRCDGAVWGTTFHITYHSERMLDDSIYAVMQAVERSLSPFADSSLVSRINLGLTTDTDTLFRRIFTTSQTINRLSDGAFDPTVAPLVNLWGFGYRNASEEPTQKQIDSVMPSVGIGMCRLDGIHIIKHSDATEFDFSAITKGYGCDLVGEMLRRNGCRDYMVEIGGEIAVSGVNPRGESWRIMIDTPVEVDSGVVHERMATVLFSSGGIATSGNYRNYRNTSTGRVGHTISPKTGRPVTTRTLSVTVTAADAMTADALATACMVMNSDSAMAMVEKVDNAGALIVTAGDDGAYKFLTSSRFPPISK